MPKPSRQLVIAAVDILKACGHNGFIRLGLEWGLPDDAIAGSGLMARANSLLTYAFNNIEHRTADGIPIDNAIVARAIELVEKNHSLSHVTEDEKRNFRALAERDGCWPTVHSVQNDLKDDDSKRRVRRYAQWEQWGVDRVKADLLQGGRMLVGGPPENREMAWEWVRLKEAEQAARAVEDKALAKRPDAQIPQRVAQLTIDQKRTAIVRLKKRRDELAAFDPSTSDFSDPRVVVLKNSIERAIVETFGADTVDYERYKGIAQLGYIPGVGGASDLDTHRIYLQQDKEKAIAVIDGIINGFKEDIEEIQEVFGEKMRPQPVEANKVFVVHGHDEAALHELARFLEKMSLKAIILKEEPNRGNTIIEKFEKSTNDVAFCVVLMTPDDVGKRATSSDSTARVRQNVIYELGYFTGKLGRGCVCLLRKGDVEIPSDLQGLIYIDMDAAEGWKIKLVKEMLAVRLKFDPTKAFD